jgi:hypothetical protein
MKIFLPDTLQKPGLVLRVAILALVGMTALASCKNDGSSISKSLNSSTGTNAPALDTSSTGKEIAVTEKDHHIYLRPKVGTTQRYHVYNKSQRTMTVNDDLFGGPQGKKESTNMTEYYIRQTVRSIKPDSSIDFAIRIDSVLFQITQDTNKIRYSSANPKDKNDKRFAQYNIIAGEEFGAIVSRNGEVTEMYGLQHMIATMMKSVPDSMQNDQVRDVANRQLQSLLNQYLGILLTHIPTKPMAKDTSWTVHAETNLPVSDAVQFPVVIDSKETVKGFEDRGGAVLVVLDAKTTTTPMKTVLEQGPIKATLGNYASSTTASTRLEDLSGLLVRRVVNRTESYTFTLESKEQAGKMARSQQTSNEVTTIDLLQ